MHFEEYSISRFYDLVGRRCIDKVTLIALRSDYCVPKFVRSCFYEWFDGGGTFIGYLPQGVKIPSRVRILPNILTVMELLDIFYPVVQV